MKTVKLTDDDYLKQSEKLLEFDLTFDLSFQQAVANSWDLFINGSGKMEFIDGAEMDNQDIATILKTNKGEDYFYENLGVDWFMIINYPTKSNVIDGINDALSQFDKPVLIRDLKIKEDKENRKYNVILDLKVEDNLTQISFNVGE